MNILIVVASKHGSTREIAEVIADEIRAAGHTIEVQSTSRDINPDGYNAAIIGSAVYMGRWLPEAREFVEEHRERLSLIPTWLFSSGPLTGDDPGPRSAEPRVQDLMTMINARGHQIFVGKLDRHALSKGERFIASMVRAPEGDFRDWNAIRAWAREISVQLTPAHST